MTKTRLSKKSDGRATQTKLRILIVDDHPTLREGLAARIETQADMEVCANAADISEALREIAACHPDLVIVDISLKNSDGLELLKTIQTRHPGVRCLVHSMYDESIYADRCLRAGAHGYVNKEADPGDVLRALREIAAGRVYLSEAMTSRVLDRTVQRLPARLEPVESLTDRQLEIFRLIGAGKTAQEIARQLHISVHTVETHRDNIKRKLDVTTLNELSRWAVLWTSENG